jgi:uncharacterized Tic20 family protein
MAEEPRVQDDQVMAALAHGAAFLPFWGIVGAIVIWATQKDKSRFVAFQALQALFYQVLPLLGGMLFGLCYFCSFASFFLAIPITGLAGEEGEGLAAFLAFLPMSAPFCIMGLAFLVWLAYVVYAVYAAVRVIQGQDFRYALIGRWLERYMAREEAAD